MITITSAPTQTEKTPGVTCQHCGEQVKLNEIVRSAYRELGCKHCFGANVCRELCPQGFACRFPTLEHEAHLCDLRSCKHCYRR
jgi:hypothetical protein